MVNAHIQWSYFPRNQRHPLWVEPFVDVFESEASSISTLSANGPNSDGVLKRVEFGLQALGFAVETGKAKHQRIRRPVLFGQNGREAVSYEIDAFHDGEGIAVEVEAGRGAQNNADYRDLVRASLILDAQYLALVMPQKYRFVGSPPDGVHAYAASYDLLEAVYSSQRLRLPFKGVLLVGY